jgi:hypothetical protein
MRFESTAHAWTQFEVPTSITVNETFEGARNFVVTSMDIAMLRPSTATPDVRARIWSSTGTHLYTSSQSSTISSGTITPTESHFTNCSFGSGVTITRGTTYRFGAWANGDIRYGRRASGLQVRRELSNLLTENSNAGTGTVVDISNVEGDTNTSSVIRVNYIHVPSAPTNVSQTSNTSSSITIGWAAPTSNGDSAITGYRVRINFGPWIEKTSSATSHQFTGLSAGTTYSFQVVALNSATSIMGTTSLAGSNSGSTRDATPVWSTATTLAPTTLGVSTTRTVVASPATTYSILTQSGGTGTYTISTVNGQGRISGTPTATGTASITVRATNNTVSADRTFTMVVNPPAPVFTDATVASPAIRDASYTDGVAATDATSYSVRNSANTGAGTLPAGLSLNTSTGAITGTPTTLGSTSFRIRATNVTGSTDTASLTIVVNPPAPVFTDATVASPAIRGVSYSDGVVATDVTGDESYSVFSGALPTGITLNTSTGAITGTPTVSGTYTFVLRATNVTGSTNTSTLTIVVNSPTPTVPTLIVSRNGLVYNLSGSSTIVSGSVASFNIDQRVSTDGGITFGSWTNFSNPTGSSYNINFDSVIQRSYQFRVRAVSDSNVVSSYNTSVTFHTPNVPLIPVNPIVLTKNEKIVTVDWDPFRTNANTIANYNGAVISGYEVEERYSSDNGVTWTPYSNIASTNASTTVFTTNDLLIAKTYQFRVRANSDVGFSAYQESSFTVFISAYGQRRTSSTFAAIETARRFDGQNWQIVSIAKKFNGTAWVDIQN